MSVRLIVASEGPISREELIEGLPVRRVAAPFRIASAPVCAGMARIFSETDADLVHIHLPNPAAVLAYLASGRRGPLVVTYHSDTIRQPLLGSMFRPFLNRLLAKSGAVIVTSPKYLETSPVLQDHRRRCRVIPMGVQTKSVEGSHVEAVQVLRKRYGPRLVLSAGRLVYYKGFDYLIRAMLNVDARLIIVGDGPLRGRLDRLVRKWRLGERVHLLGEVEDLAPYYHAADVFVLPSTARSEAFGLVQLEAMACGTPVINTAIASGVPYVSLHGITGFTAPPADSEALAFAIRHLLDRPKLRHSYGEAARRRVESEFPLVKMVRRTLDVYEEVLGEPIGRVAATDETGSSEVFAFQQ